MRKVGKESKTNKGAIYEGEPMKTLTATFAITTPMFLGDANQESTGLRPPSIKGALRFWWRALVWKDILRNKHGDTIAALKELHKQEQELFGAAAKEVNHEQVGGQGKFLLSVEDVVETVNESGKVTVPQIPDGSGCKYLLGQGMGERTPLAVKEFALKVLFKPGASAVDQQGIIDAVLIFGLLGGLGSRARKGYGSVAIESYTDSGLSANVELPEIPKTVEEFSNLVNRLMGALTNGLPPYTAFSEKTRIDISETGNNALTLLEHVGTEMQLYRSHGQNGRVGGQPAERNFGSTGNYFAGRYNDHDLALNVAQGNSNAVKTHPARVVFGLPHNYFFSSTAPRVNLNVDANGKDRARRSSPLLIHVHKFSDGSCMVVQTLLPAQFLPPCDKVALKGKGRPLEFPANVDWNVITTYLDRFIQKQAVIPRP